MLSQRYRSDPEYRAKVDAVVAKAPPLSNEQADRLAVLLQPRSSFTETIDDDDDDDDDGL